MSKILVDKVVLEQALEALEADNSKLWPSDRRTAAYFNLRAALAEPDIDPVDEYRKGFIDGQIDMRDRPEEPVQEPVAWRWTESNGKHWFDWRTDWTHHDRAKELGFHVEYAYPAITALRAAPAEPDEPDEPTYCPTCGEEDGGTTCGMPDCGLRCGAEPVQEPVVDVGTLAYRGNSVAFIYQKMTAYRSGIDSAWDAFRAKGLHPDGKTSLADMIAKHTAPPQRKPLTEELAND